MKYKLTPLFICIFFAIQVNGQIVEETIKNFREYKNISYGTISSGLNLFTAKRSSDTSYTSISLQPNGRLAFQVKQKSQEKMYYGNKLIYFDLSAKTYRIANDSLKTSSIVLPTLAYVIDKLEESKKKGSPITVLPDSSINGKAYYHIRITDLDSIRANKRIYGATTLVIDKKSYLPYYYRKDGLGFIDGTDIYVKQLDEYSFFGYKVNSSNFPDLSTMLMPKDFKLEKSKNSPSLLEKGTKAPDIAMLNMDGKTTRLKDYSGKILLISFTDNGCGYCAMSISPINKLVERYKHADFEVLNLNAFDDREAILNYNKKYKVMFHSYKPEKTTLKDYHVEAFPNFYLIDKSGYVVKGFGGFSNELEAEISKLVDQLLRSK